MKNRVLEFMSPGFKLTKSRGHLIVTSKTSEVEVPIDDIFCALILSDDVLISTNLIKTFLQKDIPIIFCDEKYEPTGSLIKHKGHHLTQKRQHAQINLSDIQIGRLWQKIVTQKVLNQHLLLKKLNLENRLLYKFANEIEIHDNTNLEAQSARFYWKTLFTDDFRRDPVLTGVNSFLNYGYAILRSAVARSLAAAGLNLALGVHHHNFENPFCLVDDLIEPFRPIVDNYVFEIKAETELNSEIKKKLALILEHSVEYKKEKKSLSSAIHEVCFSYTNAVLESDHKLLDVDINLNFYAV